MPMMTTLSRLARSRQGRKLTARAMQYARTPEGKRKLEQARLQLEKRRRRGT